VRLAAAPGSPRVILSGAGGGWRVYRVNSSNSISPGHVSGRWRPYCRDQCLVWFQPAL